MTPRRPTIGTAVDDAPDREADDVDEIRLTVPALADYARVVRLAISGLASRNGFAYDEVEDIRIAIGELFGILVATADATTRLRFSTHLSDDGLTVRAERVPATTIPSPSELSEQILAGVVGGAAVDTDRGTLEVTKRFAS